MFHVELYDTLETAICQHTLLATRVTDVYGYTHMAALMGFEPTTS